MKFDAGLWRGLQHSDALLWMGVVLVSLTLSHGCSGTAYPASDLDAGTQADSAVSSDSGPLPDAGDDASSNQTDGATEEDAGPLDASADSGESGDGGAATDGALGNLDAGSGEMYVNAVVDGTLRLGTLAVEAMGLEDGRVRITAGVGDDVPSQTHFWLFEFSNAVGTYDCGVADPDPFFRLIDVDMRKIYDSNLEVNLGLCSVTVTKAAEASGAVIEGTFSASLLNTTNRTDLTPHHQRGISCSAELNEGATFSARVKAALNGRV